VPKAIFLRLDKFAYAWVESRQFAFVVLRKCEKVSVGHLSMAY